MNTGLPLGSGFYIASLATLPNGNVAAGGLFTEIGNAYLSEGVAVWDGSAWTGMGWGVDGTVNAITALPGGGLVVGGQNIESAITSTGPTGFTPVDSVAEWNGSAWVNLSPGFGGANQNLRSVHALVPLPNGDVIGGGEFLVAGDVPAAYVARWDGSAWSALGAGVSGGSTGILAVYSAALLANGDIAVGGNFTTAGGATVNGLARWNGSAWSGFGTGVSGSNFNVSAIRELPGGDLIAGGNFSAAGGVSAASIARWYGSGWSALGAGVNGYVTSLATLPGGDIIAGARSPLREGVRRRTLLVGTDLRGRRWGAGSTGA
jgi:hypothetical protein